MTSTDDVGPGARPLDYAEGGPATLERFFRSVPLLSLSRPYPSVLALHTHNSLPQALAALAEHGFLTAPVLDDTRAVVGMVSVNDLNSAMVTIADTVVRKNEGASVDEVSALMQKEWQRHSVAEIVNVSGRSPLVPLPHDASLWDALEQMAKGGAHSVLVMSEDGLAPEAIYSQAAVMSFLFHHLGHFSTIARKMVQQVSNFSQVGSPHPFYVLEDTPVLEAFRLARDQAITGVMVLTHSRALLGVVSATDIRMLGAYLEGCTRLFSSAGDFVCKVQQQNPLLLAKVISSTPVDTVGMVMEKMLDNSVHRVFIVRTHHGIEQEVPLDVLSMQDIICLFHQ